MYIFRYTFAKEKGDVSHTAARCAMSLNIAAVRRARTESGIIRKIILVSS
jgi:hypothetical protein